MGCFWAVIFLPSRQLESGFEGATSHRGITRSPPPSLPPEMTARRVSNAIWCGGGHTTSTERCCVGGDKMVMEGRSSKALGRRPCVHRRRSVQRCVQKEGRGTVTTRGQHGRHDGQLGSLGHLWLKRCAPMQTVAPVDDQDTADAGECNGDCQLPPAHQGMRLQCT